MTSTTFIDNYDTRTPFREEEDVDRLLRPDRFDEEEAESGGAGTEGGSPFALTAPAETDLIQPSRTEVVCRLMLEYNCTAQAAHDMLDWLHACLLEARQNAGLMHPSDEQMCTPAYDLFDRCVPHNRNAPEPGSLHDLLSRHVVDRSQRELYLLHFVTIVGDRTGCNVMIQLDEQVSDDELVGAL